MTNSDLSLSTEKVIAFKSHFLKRKSSPLQCFWCTFRQILSKIELSMLVDGINFNIIFKKKGNRISQLFIVLKTIAHIVSQVRQYKDYLEKCINPRTPFFEPVGHCHWQ